MNYRHLLFITLIFFAIFISWTAGYNFDKRSPEVAFWTTISIAMSFLLSLIPNNDLDKKIFKQKDKQC